MQNIQCLATKTYKQTLVGYTGTAGNSVSYHNNMVFSTKDRDNDRRHLAVHRNTKVVGGTRIVIHSNNSCIKD